MARAPRSRLRPSRDGRHHPVKNPKAIHFPAEEVQGALRPLASLLSKSEKAQLRVAPGTWQHTMLRDNVKALRLALALLRDETNGFAREDLRAAREALVAMIGKTEVAKFSPGSSPHSLLRNRLEALRVAEARVREEMDGDGQAKGRLT